MKEIPDYIPKGTVEEIKEELINWVGKKVVRGPTWKWGNQDENINGDRTEGIVIRYGSYSSLGYGIVYVEWKHCEFFDYRVGNEFADVIFVEENNFNSINPSCCNQKMDWVNMAYKCSKCWKVV